MTPSAPAPASTPVVSERAAVATGAPHASHVSHIAPPFTPIPHQDSSPGIGPASAPGIEPAFAPGIEPTTARGLEPAFIPGIEPAFVPALESAFAAALTALETVSGALVVLEALNDADLVGASERAAAERQLVDTHAALIAGELARRSEASLGSAGLAQRLGFRTPEELVRSTTKSTAREAVTAVRVGRIISDTHTAGTTDPLTGVVHEASEPWLAPVAEALVANRLSVAAAESIRSGLGRPTEIVTVAKLHAAALELCAEASSDDARRPDADRLYRRARELREELDLSAVDDREEARRSQRSLTLRRLPDGMTRLVWLMDPETAAIGTDLYDRVTSPRRGGPRFIEAEAAALAARITADARTTEQLASDVFLELLRQGAEADSSHLLATGAPVVRVLVTLAELRERRGGGRIDGQTEAVSINTVERLACAGGSSEIVFDNDLQPLNLGREKRLFSRAQRTALEARDGGCMFGDCERPPSWCEAHHVDPWHRDAGSTDIASGILLCRHHHLLLHNNGWEISRTGNKYMLIPPPELDATQTPLPMRSKSAAYRQLERRTAS